MLCAMKKTQQDDTGCCPEFAVEQLAPEQTRKVTWVLDEGALGVREL